MNKRMNNLIEYSNMLFWVYILFVSPSLAGICMQLTTTLPNLLENTIVKDGYYTFRGVGVGGGLTCYFLLVQA